MKLEEKKFNIGLNKRPKVLFLGNGICRTFGGFDWNKLLDEIKDKDKFDKPAENYILPMPIKAILLSNNELAKKMKSLITSRKDDKENKQSIHWEDFTYCPDEMKDYINRLLDLGFDYILTTNYSYELEAALLNTSNITYDQIKELLNTVEVDDPQKKYLINTFNLVKREGKEFHIWHIHGEARKPNSMIVGHNFYGRLLSRIIFRVKDDARYNKIKYKFDKHIPIKIGSWIDSFILGDVYILGLGLRFSEEDLWWLLDQKNIYRELSGKTFFFRKAHNNINTKACPLNEKLVCKDGKDYVSEVECQNLLMDTYGINKIEINSNSYKEYYEEALRYLSKELENK